MQARESQDVMLTPYSTRDIHGSRGATDISRNSSTNLLPRSASRIMHRRLHPQTSR